jgi:tripartite-type tricarboxylate transporter receptor subunit TctC
MKRRSGLFVAAIVTIMGISPLSVSAQDPAYPSRPIRLLVGVSPGGSTDLIARLVAGKLSARLGQQVVVDNRSGASGIIAAQMVSRSQPNGYTLMLAGASISIVGSLYTKAGFDVQRDLEPLALVATTPYVMVAHPSIGVKNLSELIAYAKANNGKISHGAGTPGTVQHLSGEMFKRMAGINMTFVPYKGSSDMLVDTLAGRLQVAMDNVVILAPYIKNGALRPLAVSTAKRTTILPDVPTFAESGMAGFDTSGWFSMYSAPKTPPHILKKLNTEIVAIVNEADVRERLLGFGATPLPGTPDDLRKQLAREVPTWRKVIQEAGVKFE